MVNFAIKQMGATMKYSMCASLGAVALAIAGPAQAEIGPQTVVQVDSLAVDRGFLYFDSSLGVLQSVRLEITPNFTRAFQAIYPGVLDSARISWDASDQQYCYNDVCSALFAQGEADLDLTYSPNLPGSYDYIIVEFGGQTLTTYLDPQNFIDPPHPLFRRYLARIDPGFYDDSLTDIFEISDGGYVRNAQGLICRSSVSGCDRSVFRLIYSYAPGGVPEPSTWFMMILGFGLIGGALRRSQAAVRQLAV